MTGSGSGSDAQPTEPQQDAPPAQPAGWESQPPQQPGAWQAPPAQPAGWQAPPQQQANSQQTPPQQQAGWQQTPPSGGGWSPPGAPGAWSAPPIQQGPAAGITYAGFLVRFVAYIIDAIILGIINAILGSIFLSSAISVNLNTGSVGVGVNYGALLIVTIIELAISAVYFVYTWTNLRASPGDKVLGLMVLNEADGSALTMNQAAIRWLILAGPAALSSVVTYATSGVGAIVGLVVFLWYIYLAYSTATDPKRQGFHDKYVHSVVVKATLA